MIKVTRKMLLIITASLGVLIIVYGLVRQFFGIGLSEKPEKYFFEVIVIAALGLFMYNRKMARDERQAKEAAAETERRALSGDSQEEPLEDENLPHWERYKKNAAKTNNEEENEENEENED